MSEQEQNPSDEELARRVQVGDIEVFGQLIERYEQKMLRYAGKFLFDPEAAQDIVQEVFIKAYTNISSFDLQRKFSPWLYRIAHNSFINEIKKNSRVSLLSLDTDIFLPHFFSKEDSEKDLLDKEQKENLEACISKINLKYREVLVLHYFEGFSYKEISDILHIPIAAVGIRLSRGRKALKKNFNPLK